MAAIPPGFNFATDPITGVAFDICWTIDTIKDPEYPLPPFTFGSPIYGQDNSQWVFVKPRSAYSIGTVGYIDSNWNFIALTIANSVNAVGCLVGVMSQVASIIVNPTPFNYDGIWVQVFGLCPAINVAASTTAYAPLYASVIPGQLTSNYSGSQIIDSIVVISTSTNAGPQPGILA